jgi:hypothetical protein
LGHIGGQGAIHEVGDTVEADGGAIERGKIKVTHVHPL